MTPETPERAPVTDRAGGLVQVQLARGVGRHKVLSVIGRLEVSVLGVALFATERVLDLAVANQAIRHLRHRGRGHRVGVLQAPMTRLAGVLGVEVSPDIPRWL